MKDIKKLLNEFNDLINQKFELTETAGKNVRISVFTRPAHDIDIDEIDILGEQAGEQNKKLAEPVLNIRQTREALRKAFADLRRPGNI